MTDQGSLYPTGVTRAQFQQLTELAGRALQKSFAELRAEIRVHLEQTAAAQEHNRLVNLRLANAIGERMLQLIDRWDQLSADARHRLGSAFLYFASCNDDEPDFDSPIGFEGDTEVLNACLRFARLDELCLNVEEYVDQLVAMVES